ncbi:cytochrome c3 family protein [Sulfurimonas sp.]|uniref:cytochrome c3 family protein n=1 Tax=Sulfurimonas sp. TaxID=2022749 RepID=UPI003566D479
MRSVLTKSIIIISLLLTGLYAVVVPNGEINDTTSGSEEETIVYAQPDSVSLVCLGCHDGVNALNMAIGNGRNIGNFMEGSHPVSIEYIEGIAGLRPKTDAVTAIRGAKTVNDLLVNGKVECISCHDKYGIKDGDPSPYKRYLRNENKGSALCYACHNK